MSTYTDMTYFELKSECAKQGKSSKGKKEELVYRLEGQTVKIPEPPEKEILANPPELEGKKPATPNEDDRLGIFMPEAEFTQQRDTSAYADWLTSERLEKLAGRLDAESTGKGKWEYQLNYEKGSFQVEFDGRAIGKHGTTLIDTDNQIVKQAHYYFNARLAMGGNGQASRL